MKNIFWHVCYVKPRSEKIVKKKVEELRFEVFLPLILHTRAYKTAKKTVQLPLFNGYIFVKIEQGYRHHISAIPEVYGFIKFRDEYAKVSDEEINNLKILVQNVKNYNEICSDITFETGKCVEVIAGPFSGMKGKMVDKYGKNKVIIEI
ncbi:MAG: UpxY family transcription antiterminator, partial [Bacteroidales bacterium]|nr:UpxY family transcription antiterminator [Bacteroidales bacterium]